MLQAKFGGLCNVLGLCNILVLADADMQADAGIDPQWQLLPCSVPSCYGLHDCILHSMLSANWLAADNAGVWVVATSTEAT